MLKTIKEQKWWIIPWAITLSIGLFTNCSEIIILAIIFPIINIIYHVSNISTFDTEELWTLYKEEYKRGFEDGIKSVNK